ncbi:Mechanosensitive ion channel-domain-containing protein [Xylariaceae sp. FL0804]|nr:Mechanosensitive ion channel-domain-containing protein [Xylariaceae sp. FL0804]
MPENGIPLTQVRSNASSTGARRPNQGLGVGLERQQTGDSVANSPGNDEKRGFFHRGRRRAKKEDPNRALASKETSLNSMGKFYNRIVHASAVTRYLTYMVPVGLILAVPLIVLPTTGSEDTTVGKNGPPLWRLFLWIEISWIACWIAKLVAWLMAPVFMFFTGVVSAGTRKYAAILNALQIPLSLFFWALADYLVFVFLIETPFPITWTKNMKKVLGATLVSSAVFLGERTLIQLISVTYHQRSFANRIADSKREVYLLGLLYEASRKLFPQFCAEFIEEDEIINDSIEMLLGEATGFAGNRKSGVATPMKLIGNVGRFGNKVTSAFGNLASEITGKQVFNPNSAHSIVVEALEKPKTSEALAKRIWMSFVVEGKDSLFVEDIDEVLGPGHSEEAEECFGAIDADGNGDISLDEMILKVIEIGKERKAIGNSMQDIGQALSVFDNVLLFVVLLIVIFVFLAFFQSSFITTLATAGTALLSLSFVFAVTTQEFLGSCIFLFVKHPYDVGDRVDIVGSEKEQLVVERISLLYTIFNRIDKMQTVQVPNIVLNNLWIENVTRSKAMKDIIDVNVSFGTSFEDLELLRLEMERFVREPENARDFLPDIIISVAGVGDLDKLQLKIAIKYKSNWHNEAVRATRLSKFMCALTLAMKKVPINAPGGGSDALGGPSNPTYSVSVSDAAAIAAREKSAKDKEAARLVPPPTITLARNASNASKLDASQTEQQAAQMFNTRNPAQAAGDDWGYNRDDTANDSSEALLERQRSQDIEAVRTELHKSQSQRGGRRRAGDSVPTENTGQNAPGFQFSQHMAPFDEEAQMGANPYAMSNPALQEVDLAVYPQGASSSAANVSRPLAGNATSRTGGTTAPRDPGVPPR